MLFARGNMDKSILCFISIRHLKSSFCCGKRVFVSEGRLDLFKLFFFHCSLTLSWGVTNL